MYFVDKRIRGAFGTENSSLHLIVTMRPIYEDDK